MIARIWLIAGRTDDSRGILEAVWAEPDPLLIEAGARGELLVARVRPVLSGILLGVPVVTLATAEASARETVVGFRTNR